ncbi:maleylpyruvate isomerase family mycothiol-dependent enzyme [Dietzia cinnamea]|uniref:maleylpyruvate isomerase family mycothiol-dependent enzyme n=1 Tax=Dietzia cinnamea TaxID=321318 RepID=UPI0021A771A2|nr:maleylpyruvate isomerase family mycothiol-dependent enzyme [Dietzia cinnamea]MCT1638344.1 maleylpyruvate isomerase family mycothiol-dependent enzyme [Dietzia cinnamea]
MTGGSDSGSASRLTHARMLDALEAQVGLVRFALAGDGSGGSGSGAADVTAAVPSCPDWTVRDLVAHLGTVNWWAGQTVRDATPDARTRGMSAVQRSAPPATDGAAALADWYARIADEMLRTLTDTAPDAPAWTFSGAGRADFWLRRQLHETTIHRWDVETALHGAAATTPVSEDVAVDGVDEFCTVMRPHFSGRVPALPLTIRLRAVPHATGGAAAAGGLAAGAEPVGAGALGALEWELPGPPDGGEVEVAGPPETLALLLWGRVRSGAADLEVTGDRDGLDAALEAGLSA